MEVYNIIIHELRKPHMAIGANLDLSSSLLDIDENATKLISELNDRYKGLNVTHAVFGNGEGDTFPQQFLNYFSNSSHYSFLIFTRDSITDLKNKIENISAAKGGYLVYAYYKEVKEFIGIFLIRNTEGVLFTKVSDKFQINPQFHIDFEKMAMACRINKESYENSSDRYLSFIKKRNEDTSEYFVNWICATDKVDNKTDTKNLHEILVQIPFPNDSNGNPNTKEVFLSEVVNYIKSRPDKIINIKDLGTHFYNDENKIIEFANANEIKINTEFKPDATILRTFVNVKVKADDIEIKFPASKYNEIITIAQDNRSITIRSRALAEKIRNEMNDNESRDR